MKADIDVPDREHLKHSQVQQLFRSIHRIDALNRRVTDVTAPLHLKRFASCRHPQNRDQDRTISFHAVSIVNQTQTRSVFYFVGLRLWLIENNVIAEMPAKFREGRGHQQKDVGYDY